MYRITKIISVTLLLLTGLNAVVAGLLFMVLPDGSGMGMNTDYLEPSPFSSYFIPGLILFFVNGVMNLLAAVHTLKKGKFYPQWILLQGLLLLGWIGIQVVLVRDFNFLHTAMLLIGFVLIIYAWLLRKRERGEKRELT
jgi:hypothetical protein